MNNVQFLGNITRDVEVRYSQTATPIAVARYGLAVKRQFSKQGEKDVDFLNIVAFGKAAEFAEKYFRKGMQVVVTGRLQVNEWEDKDRVKHTSTDIVAEHQYFAERKSNSEPQQQNTQGFVPTGIDNPEDELPF